MGLQTSCDNKNSAPSHPSMEATVIQVDLADRTVAAYLLF